MNLHNSSGDFRGALKKIWIKYRQPPKTLKSGRILPFITKIRGIYHRFLRIPKVFGGYHYELCEISLCSLCMPIRKKGKGV